MSYKTGKTRAGSAIMGSRVVVKGELLRKLILEYSNDLATVHHDAESERKNDIKRFIQQLRVMLAGEAIDAEVPASVITDSDERLARNQKRARSGAKGSIGVWKPDREGTFVYLKPCCQ